MPVGQDRIGIIKIRLARRMDRSAAGFLYDIHRQGVRACPFLYGFNFGRDQVPSADAERFHNGIDVFVVHTVFFLGFRNGADSLICPGYGNFFHITKAGMTIADACFNQVFN